MYWQSDSGPLMYIIIEKLMSFLAALNLPLLWIPGPNNAIGFSHDTLIIAVAQMNDLCTAMLFGEAFIQF